jgi:REP element-mobilizing transposase RayT
MLIETPPKYSVAQVIGYIKGKRAIARRFMGKEKNFTGQNFWGERVLRINGRAGGNDHQEVYPGTGR